MNNETVLAEILDRGSDLSGPDFVTFLRTEAESNEMEHFAGQATSESCGCRAFYPSAVGDKAPYEVQQ
ncbi:hypothetical protein [Marivivens marinus]|uniref:hypothetical protein n=1 Tax=Marivivens marinus TaxID=3110173 RepID=UPI003B845D5E